MQNLAYEEFLQESTDASREQERLALDKSITLMLQAGDLSNATAVAKAVKFSSRLWTVLIEDLADPGNGLPKELKAQIVSIGIWILRELERVRTGEAKSFADVIQVSKAIREGLL